MKKSQKIAIWLLDIGGLIFFFVYYYFQFYLKYGAFFYTIPILCFLLSASIRDYKLGWWVMIIVLIVDVMAFITLIQIF